MPGTAYHELPDSASRGDVKTALSTIVQVPSLIPPSSLRSVVQTLVNDAHTCTTSDAPCKLRREDAGLALSALKCLGRNASASAIVASSENLSLMLAIEKGLRQSEIEAANEGMRCIANALLLIESSRDTWVEIGGAAYCAERLKYASSPVDLFLLCRILFLSTTETSPFLETLMNGLSESASDSENIVTVVGDRLDFILERLLNGESFSREALVDLLKFAFNLLCHIPKLSLNTNASTSKIHARAPSFGLSNGPELGERWDERLDGILPPLLRVFNGLPFNKEAPLAPPMPHVLHALLAPPASDDLKPAWLEDKGKAVESPSETSTPSAFKRALVILETSFQQYIPGNIDPDDKSVREKAAQRDEDLTHMLLPVVLVIAKYCHLSAACRSEFRRKVIPQDLDRTTPLEQHADTLGRCIRLMASVHFERLKDAVGEMLYAACNSDAQLLSRLIGYGNAAGFLFNRGITAPPPNSDDDSDDRPSVELGFDDQSAAAIDPISGMVKLEEQSKPLDEMTEEEKEREAEKLFVLFERMEKATGMENPLKKAFHEGKLEKYAK